MAQLVKNLSAMWETWVQSLGWEDTLEKGKVSKLRQTLGDGGQGNLMCCSPWGRKESYTAERLNNRRPAGGNQGCLQQLPRAFVSVAPDQVILWDKIALGH